MSAVITSVAPMLSVREGARAVEFYKAAFGAVETYRVESPDGAVVSRLAIDGSEFWVADESPEHANFSPATLNGCTTRIILTIAEPVAVWTTSVAIVARGDREFVRAFGSDSVTQ